MPRKPKVIHPHHLGLAKRSIEADGNWTAATRMVNEERGAFDSMATKAERAEREVSERTLRRKLIAEFPRLGKTESRQNANAHPAHTVGTTAGQLEARDTECQVPCGQQIPCPIHDREATANGFVAATSTLAGAERGMEPVASKEPRP